MDIIYNLGYYLALFIIPFVLYFLLFKKNDGRSVYTGRDWFYLIKLYFAKNAVRKYQEKYRSKNAPFGEDAAFEKDVNLTTDQHTNSQYFYGADQKGNSFSLVFSLRHEKIAEVYLCLRLSNGKSYVLPDENHIRLTKIPNDEWKINGLSIEILEPLSRFRIVFNGLLEQMSVTHSKKVEYVRCSLIFNSCGSPTYFPQGMDANLLADALAKENWRDGSWVNYLVDQNGYEQFGVLQGYIKGESYATELVLNLPSCRTVHKGIDDRFLLKRALRIFIADAYGNLINIVIKSFKNGCSQMNYGSVILSNNIILPIKEVDLVLSNLSSYKIIPDMITTEIRAGDKLFRCVIHLNRGNILVVENGEENGFECHNVPAECDINAHQGKVLIEFWFNKNGTQKFTPNALLQAKTVLVLPGEFVVNIRNKKAKILVFSGGKGTSLALLSSLNSADFTIPEGFIITVNSFKHQLQSNSVLAKTVLLLDDVCRGEKEGNLEAICTEVVTMFKKEKMLPEIAKAIIKELNNVETSESIGWAVRSSAIGEDSEEFSAAGQNDTFLGCLTEEQILRSVLACWASLFSYQSVHYRWQHGLPVLTEMAVVVQKMVPADSAGVLFTCHPFSLNPSQMVITSNFGLGESVVSGKSDPDTIVLSRTWDDKVSVLNKNIGRKNKVFKMTGAGVEEKDNDGEDTNWSISDDQALQLGKLGVALEKAFGTPRDIEWAFCKDKLYLLQSRPITTLNSWSEFDLTHELDYPVRSDYTILSTGNIGEVTPNALTVLSQTTSMLCAAWAADISMRSTFDPLGFQYILHRHHRGLLDIVNFVHKNVNADVKVSSTILDLAIFGHPVLDEQLNIILKNFNGITPPINLLKEALTLLSHSIRNRSNYRQMKERLSDFKIEINLADSVLENYKKFDCIFEKLPYILNGHTKSSSVSAFYQVITLNILLEGSNTLTNDHCKDFATILSCCNDVISAEVPKYLESIARIIREEGYDEQFCAIDPKFGVAFLENKCPEAYKLFQEFLEKHGHRSQGEFEIMEESWSDNPSKVISMVQANAKQETNMTRSNKTTNEIIKSLVSPKSAITRSIIKFLIKQIRSSVAIRELTKCELVRSIVLLRQAYRLLAKQMVSQGLLPSAVLIYHLTHYEIGQVIEKRNPLLVSKAIKRHKLYPKWNRIRFPELSIGIPVPENDSAQSEIDVDKVCVGTAACAGTVTARACVIHSLEEINHLETGDILITVGTDIGWSPYFPMLSGIVTELGGLISHGAVVAREYGLPCIVGVKDATKVFKTGDRVILSGNTGKIGKASNISEVL